MLNSDDIEYIHKSLNEIASDIEESIIYRKYINTTTGDHVLGTPDTSNYNDYNITARVRMLTLEEIQVSGGVYVLGDMKFIIRKKDWMQWDIYLTGAHDPSLPTIKPDYPDRIRYNGVTYKPKSYSHMWLGGVLWYKVKAGKT